MKLAVIGGCGVRAPQLVRSAVRRSAQNGLDELWLMDIDPTRLRLIGELCQAVAVLAGSPVRVFCTDDARSALDGADYIITTVRVGGDHARVLDEKIALQNGVLGQETTGAGGFAMAMRSIPVILEYAELAEKYAPTAWLFNFTNPAGLVTQALHQAGYARSVGICDSANHAQNDVARWLGIPSCLVRAEVFGLNHLSWASRVCVNGQDVLPGLLADPVFRLTSSLRVFDAALLDLVQLYPNEYLYYYYYAEKAVDQIQHLAKTRGEEILELNQALLEKLASLDIGSDPAAALAAYDAYVNRRSSTYMHYASPGHPGLEHAPQARSAASPASAEDDEGYAGFTLDLISTFQSGTTLETALNVPNQGAISWLAADDIVEVTCRVSGKSIHPIPISFGRAPLSAGRDAIPDIRSTIPAAPVVHDSPDDVYPQINSAPAANSAHSELDPLSPSSLIQSVKLYERLAVDAIHHRSRRLAVQALMAHPLVLSYTRASRLVDEYLSAHAASIGEWK